MKKILVCLLFAGTFFLNARATTYTFIGSHNSDWSNASNWKSPAGVPGAVILKSNTIIIEAPCVIPQGIVVTNYGKIVISNQCYHFDFHTINNYGIVLFEQQSFYHSLGSTFKNYPSGTLIIHSESLKYFCHLENEGTILKGDLFAKSK